MEKCVRKLGVLLVFLFLFVSCNQGAGSKNGKEQNDPKLVLKSLTILRTRNVDIEVDPMTCKVDKERLVSTDIVAKFDYGEETDEAIGVVLEGGEFIVDKTKPTAMIMKVPAVKGLYQAWTGSVMITLEAQDMEVVIAFDGLPQPDGTQKELPLEVVEFIVQCREDIVDKAIINDGTQDHELKLKEFPGEQGSKFYANTLKLPLNTDDYNAYKVTVKPKDPVLYRETVVNYRIKGTKIADNNAEFIYINDGAEESPNVVCDVTWEKDCESQYIEDYGVKSLKMTAFTVSPRASVFVKSVNPLDDSMLSATETQLTSDGKGMHTGEITVFSDKPTKLVAYVKAKDGTIDNNKGKWQVEFNAIGLFWGYDASKLSSEELRKGANKAYSEVKIKKALAVGNKVFVAFTMWDENVGFRPGDEISKMSDYAKLDSFGDPDYGLKQAYQFSVDVSTLAVGEEKDIEIPVLRIIDANGEVATPPINAFKYKIKIKVE